METTPHGNLEKRTKLISEDRNCWCNFLSSCLVPSYKCCLQSFIQLAIKLFLEVLDDYVELLVETDALGRKLKEFLKVFVLSFLSRFLNFGLDIKTEYSIKIFLVKLWKNRKKSVCSYPLFTIQQNKTLAFSGSCRQS